ncbi:hypothetical protein [Streptomyces sp. NK15101]|uniref:hypothetical protein n=1 Tax=Streptomyces sp. NK15101 TaxID=2873261 RepID=UPI001CEDABB9|nr:hypothetical protein [Streptomyces sp. NK15101]
MPDTVDAAAVLLAAAAQQGLGDTLRILLLASIAGGALLAWFLLRGYRSDDTGDGGGDGTGDGGGTDRGANA